MEIDVDRGYFTYFREDLDTFDRGYNEAYSAFEKAALLQHPYATEPTRPAIATNDLQAAPPSAGTP